MQSCTGLANRQSYSFTTSDICAKAQALAEGTIEADVPFAYFRSEIWASDTNLGYRLQKIKAEKGLEGGDISAEHRSVLAKLLRRTKTSK